MAIQQNPLKKYRDAILIDNSYMSVEEQIELIIQLKSELESVN